MARYQIILSYDGAGFVGSQRQSLSHDARCSTTSRTVQGELERALICLGWQGKSVLMAGRTDTGVHASGQVAAFDYHWNHQVEDLISALNSHLPMDIAVTFAKVVRDDFHPRFDASSRCYRYRLFCQPLRNPLRERYVWRVWPVLNEDILHQIAESFLGQHDFGAFGSPPKPGGSTVRTIMKSTWWLQGDEWTFEVQADGFLYRMVRKLVHIQVAVAQGRTSVDAVVGALNDKRQGIPGGLAPANGLTLVEVTYPTA